MPQRIQLRRTKGWRLPTTAINVARPTRWGNPFKVRREYGDVWAVETDGGLIQQVHGEKFAVALTVGLYRGLMIGWNPSALPETANFAIAYEAHLGWLTRRGAGGSPIDLARTTLRGHDLACWCPLDQRCHADVLLELANR